jgi:hypothetical protein
VAAVSESVSVSFLASEATAVAAAVAGAAAVAVAEVGAVSAAGRSEGHSGLVAGVITSGGSQH